MRKAPPNHPLRRYTSARWSADSDGAKIMVGEHLSPLASDILRSVRNQIHTGGSPEALLTRVKNERVSDVLAAIAEIVERSQLQRELFARIETIGGERHRSWPREPVERVLRRGADSDDTEVAKVAVLAEGQTLVTTEEVRYLTTFCEELMGALI
jgi:hypothetical protein